MCLPIMDEARDTRLKRLRLRSWRRGMKEMDLILGRFADERLADLSAEALDNHEHLMGAPDQDLYRWITGAEPAPAEYEAALGVVQAHLQETH